MAFAGGYQSRQDCGRLVRYFIAESTVTDARATERVAGGMRSGWATIPTNNEDRLKWNVLSGPGVSDLMFDTAVAGALAGQPPDTFSNLVTATVTLDYEPANHLFIAVEHFYGRLRTQTRTRRARRWARLGLPLPNPCER